MKTYVSLGAVGIAAFMFFSCANQATNTQTASNTDPGNRTYTGQQLENTGQAQAGPALRRIDPSVDRTR